MATHKTEIWYDTEFALKHWQASVTKNT